VLPLQFTKVISNIQLLGSYAPTLIQPWSRINVNLSLYICKMGRKTELKRRSISFYLLQYHAIFHLCWYN